MRKIIKLAACSLALFAFATACTKEDVGTTSTVSVETPAIPVTEVARQQLDASKEGWNAHMNPKSNMKHYKVVNVIRTENERVQLISELMYSSSMMAVGNVSNPNTVQIETVATLFKNEPANSPLLKDLQALMNTRIQVGDKVAEITWVKGANEFTTKCVLNESGIVWDNILYGVHVTPAPVEETQNILAAVKIYRFVQPIHWIWGEKRGEMGYAMRINYSDNGVLLTNIETWATMKLGSVLYKDAVKQNDGAQGVAKIAMGIATPMTQLSFDETAFTVNGNGANTLNLEKVLVP